MPDFDGGHYFLTVLAPIRNDVYVDGNGQRFSRPDMLREILDRLPTAEPGGGPPDCPFTANRRTHLARFVVIGDVIYNGRIPSNPILSRLTGAENLTVPQPVDRLRNAYLLFSADIDTASGADSELDSYLTELWETMEAVLRSIFRHCAGFEDSVNNATEFCAYIRQCQVETTMPFNDYWAHGLPAKNPPLLALSGAVLAALSAGALWLGWGEWPWWGWAAAAAAILCATLAFAYFFVTIKGGKPFPTAPNSDLASILKALYLHRHFVKLAIENQGASDSEIHANFGRFIKDCQPLNLDTPTQQPGVIQ